MEWLPEAIIFISKAGYGVERFHIRFSCESYNQNIISFNYIYRHRLPQGLIISRYKRMRVGRAKCRPTRERMGNYSTSDSYCGTKPKCNRFHIRWGGGVSLAWEIAVSGLKCRHNGSKYLRKQDSKPYPSLGIVAQKMKLEPF